MEQVRKEIDALRSEISTQIRSLEDRMNEKLKNYGEKAERDLVEAQKETRARLQSIDHQARNNGQSTIDLSVEVKGISSRLNLLFGEDGRGFFTELRDEVKGVNLKIMYASGFLAAVYFIVSWLLAHHII